MKKNGRKKLKNVSRINRNNNYGEFSTKTSIVFLFYKDKIRKQYLVRATDSLLNGPCSPKKQKSRRMKA